MEPLEAPEKPSLSWIHWIVASLACGIISMSYVHSFVYPRTEGERLERRVDEMEKNQREDQKAILEKLEAIWKYMPKRRDY